MIEKIREKLFQLSDKNYKEFNLKNCPDTKKEMIGVRIPQIRKIAIEISRNENWKEIVNQLDSNIYEETMIEGLVIAYSKDSLQEKIPYIEKYICKMDSWSITDIFVPTLKIKDTELELYWNFILKYINSQEEFEVRFAIISMLKYYIKDEYVDKVIENLTNIKHEGYYVKMAVAWTLAEIGIKYNDKILKLLEKSNVLDKFTYNKTIQKMIESYRISDEQKNLLKKMKIK